MHGRGSRSYRFLSVVVISIILGRVELSHGVRSGMASIRLQPPESFDFKRPDEWPRWKKRFQQFRSASTLDGEAEDRQVNTLLYCMGEEAENVLSSTGISDEDRKKYDKVVEKFDLYFAVRRNVIFERARFNRRVQHEGELAETYISELYELIEFCDYGNLKDEMLRDRLMVGIRDTSLSEKMQTDPALTLEKAKTMIYKTKSSGQRTTPRTRSHR